MDDKTMKYVLIGAAVILLLLFLKGGSGGASVSVPDTSATDQAKIAAQSQAFSQLAGVVGNVAETKAQGEQNLALANVQAGIENNRTAAALAGLTLQNQAQIEAINSAESARKQDGIIDTIGHVATGILTLGGIL